MRFKGLFKAADQGPEVTSKLYLFVYCQSIIDIPLLLDRDKISPVAELLETSTES